MRRFANKTSIIRTGSVAAVALTLLAGVTFAALLSRPAKLTGTTIQTASANLQISNDGTHYADSQTGFTFGHIIPGSGTGDGMGNFYLRNTGDTALSLKLAVLGTVTNPDHVDLSKVMISINDVTTHSDPQNFTLQALVDASSSGGVLVTVPSSMNVTETHQFHLFASMDVDAVSASSASIGNIDLAFTGVAHS